VNLPLVRLSKDRKWACCVSVGCGERFARRLWRPLPLRPPNFTLDFLAGWVEDRDAAPVPLWRMSGRAWKRLSQGRQPAFRRPSGGWADEAEMADAAEAGLDMKRDRTDRPWRDTTNAHSLPAVVVCPKCKRHQLADPQALECV
jgi:hypothetical protein